MGKTTNNAVAARKLARERRLKLDEDRAARDQRVEDAAAAVFVAQTERDDALAAVTAAETSMAGSVRTLLEDEGLTQTQTAELLDLDAAEVRRLAKVAVDTATAPTAAAGGGSGGE